MPPFVNLSNHPSGRWDEPQRAAAAALGTSVLDVPFPTVPATLGVGGLPALVEETLTRIPGDARVVMVAGECTLTAALVVALQARGVRCVGPSSERFVEHEAGGEKRVSSRFVRFRDYLGNPETALDPDPAVDAERLPEPRGDGLVTPPPPDRRALLAQISQQARYRAPTQLATALREFLSAFPDEGLAAEGARANGEAMAMARDVLKAALRRDGPDSDAAQQLAQETFERYPLLGNAIRSDFEYERKARLRGRERAVARSEGRSLTTVEARGEHRVHALPPGAAWTLWIDETGERFEGTEGTPGRVVGLLVPEGVTLPTLARDFHAATSSDAAVDAAVQGVLDAPVGVFGVAVDALGPAPGERWSDAVLEVVAWVARLLPLPDDGRVRLDVRVEQRGTFAAGDRWRLGVRDVLKRLAALAPSRAARLDLHIETMAKDGRTPLGQADALAFTWGSSSEASRVRYAAARLAGTCCVDLSAQQLRAAWEAWEGARPPDGPAWRKLVAAAGPGDDRTLLGRLLEDLAARTRDEPDRWATWLAATAAHLDGKALDMRALGREVAWLATAAPEAGAVPVRLRLAWLVARLAEANHRGALDEDGLSAEIDALSGRLFDEDPRLVCLADLHRAVLATNRLDLDAASIALARWEGAPPALPGLQFWGRLRSTVGQHHAFRGEHAAARACFAEALDAFARLSDPVQARLEAGQTGAYLAIATMDDPQATDAEARTALEAVVGALEVAIPHLCASGAHAEKYAQHLLLRWLIIRGGPAELDAWLATRDRWKLGEGHPWPLVAFYRAVLLDRTRGRAARVTVLDYANRAVRLAEATDQGWTVRLIGATLAAAATVWDRPWPDAVDRLADLRENVPAADVGAIEAFIATPGDPLTLLARVLPFNFR